MLADISAAAQAERRKDQLTIAARYRRAAEVAPPATLRRRLGRSLVALGVGLAGDRSVLRPSTLSLGEESGQWNSC
jgi:hypothetical protein